MSRLNGDKMVQYFRDKRMYPILKGKEYKDKFWEVWEPTLTTGCPFCGGVGTVFESRVADFDSDEQLLAIKDEIKELEKHGPE